MSLIGGRCSSRSLEWCDWSGLKTHTEDDRDSGRGHRSEVLVLLLGWFEL